MCHPLFFTTSGWWFIVQIKSALSITDFTGIYEESISKYQLTNNEPNPIILNFRKSFRQQKSLLYELLGFKNTDIITIDKGATIESSILTNISIPYIDVVMPEIPYIACKQNTIGNHIIERINVNQERGSMIVFEKLNLYEQNYFYPIVLDKLTIQLFQKHNIPYEHDINNNYELEITTL